VSFRADEVRLRRALRDLVALSTVPAAWVGRGPHAIAAGLADVLVSSLYLDFVFVRLCDPDGSAAVEITRGDAWHAFPEWLRQYFASNGRLSRTEIVRDIGGRTQGGHGIVLPVGVNAEGGLVAAACDRADFPCELDQLLLSVAANHATTAFRMARLVHDHSRAEKALRESERQLRKAHDELETKVVERTAELQRSEAKIRRLVDANIIGIFIYALEGRIIEANDAFLRTLGYDREDLTSGRLRWQDLTPPEWLERDEQLWVPELKATGILQPYEKEYFRKDGSRVPVLIGAASFDETGNQGVAFVLDLTERKRADQALRESEEQWKAVFENNPAMYFMVDPTGTIMSVNPFGAEHLGYTADELIGRPVQNLFHETDREIIRRHMASCLEQLGHASSWELRKVRKDGEVLWVRETARAMLIKQQPVVLIVCEDITERKLAEETLGKVQMELAHANRVATMGQLTSSIAHEVSQPIAATIMSAQAALHWLGAEPPALEEVRQALERIVKNGSRAGEVIDKIRAIIKKAPPRTDRLDINEAILEVIELTRGEAVKNGVSVQTDLADGLPLIEGDRVQLQQVILNLLINAIQAMSGDSEGARELLISTARAEPNGLVVAVQDSGPGLAPEVLARLFEPFYTTKPGGLGLGLSICRSIIEAHGGRLWASANTPRGAIFQFTLPRDAMEGRPEQPASLVETTAGPVGG